MIFKNDQKDFTGAVKQYAEKLKSLNSSTENDFLFIGASMDDIFSKSTKISLTSTSAVELIASKKVSEDEKRLKNVFEMIKEHLQYSQIKLNNSFTILQKMLKTSKDADVHLDIFKGIVKRLRVLSVATKIENARLASSDNSFNVLAVDIEKLSVIISTKTIDILKGLSQLQNEVRQVLDRMVSFRDSKLEITQSVLDGILTNFRMLSEKRMQSSEAVQRLAIQSEKVSHDISEVVLSLQFHDITRQKIEHVAETFDEICSAAEKKDANGNFFISVIRDVGRLQIQQLENAKNEFVSAVKRIIENLEGLTDRVVEISGEGAKLLDVTGGDSSSFISELERSISAITVSFNKSVELDNELINAVCSVSDKISGLSAFASDIEEIGLEIELIAINALIKAVHTGEKGAALSVLAESIRILSDSAREQASAFTATLKSIGDTAMELGVKSEDKDKNNSEKAEDIKGIMEGLHDSFDITHQNLLVLFSNLETETVDLSEAIKLLVNSVTAHTKTDEVIGGVIGGLHESVSYAERLLPKNGDGDGNESDYIKQLFERYTMHEERYIHKSHFDKNMPFHSIVEKTEINRKSSRPHVIDGNSNNGSKDDFGDNVELF